MVLEVVQQSFANAVGGIVQFLPALIAAIIILIIGWIIGRIGGGIMSKILRRANLDETVGKTDFGKAVEQSGMTITGLFSAIVRWFIYLIFIMAAVNVLNIPVFTYFLNQVVLYIPNLIAGVLILVIGLILVNFVMDWIGGMLKSQNVAFADIIITALKALLSLVVIVLTLDQLRIQTAIIYTFLVPLAWGIAAGFAIAIGIAVGMGAKDVVAKYLQKMAETGEKRAKKEKEMKGKEFREPGEGI